MQNIRQWRQNEDEKENQRVEEEEEAEEDADGTDSVYNQSEMLGIHNLDGLQKMKQK